MLNFDGIKFDEIESMDMSMTFTPIPDGVYESKVVNVAIAKAASGISGIKVEFEIVEGAYAKRKIFHTFWMESKNGIENTKVMINIFRGFLNSCGIDKEERELLFKSGYAPNGLFVSLSEKIYTINIGHHEYKKDSTSDVKIYNDFNGVVSVKSAGSGF